MIVRILSKAVPILLTLVVVLVALFVLAHLWRYYMYDPWTRDAHVNANVVQVAPDVSGLVVKVLAKDNQPVHRNDVLFVIDQERFKIALEQAESSLQQAQASQQRAEATLQSNKVTLAELQREAARDLKLRDLVATEAIEERRSRVDEAAAAVADAKAGVAEAKAAVASAKANLDEAKLNLRRTEVLSPVDGRVNDSLVRVGDYVTSGRPVFAVVDTASLRVDAYFEETRLPGIHIGDPVDIYLMGEKGSLRGHVDSIAAGIADRYRTNDSRLLPNVTPAFDWVRLAQRIPVRIKLNDVPDNVRLIVGRTATVKIGDEAKKDNDKQQAEPKASTEVKANPS